jgi:phenylalanyl-tRNA synthetase beta chain
LFLRFHWRHKKRSCNFIITYFFSKLQAVVYKLFRIIGVEPIVKPGFHPLLVKGRTGEIRSPSGSYLGVIGEVKPQVLLDYGIDYPAIIGEFDLEELMEAASWNG